MSPPVLRVGKTNSPSSYRRLRKSVKLSEFHPIEAAQATRTKVTSLAQNRLRKIWPHLYQTAGIKVLLPEARRNRRNTAMNATEKTDILIRQLIGASNRAARHSDVDKRILVEQSLRTAEEICEEASGDRRAAVIEAALILREAAEDLGILRCCPKQVAANLLNTAAAARSSR